MIQLEVEGGSSCKDLGHPHCSDISSSSLVSILLVCVCVSWGVCTLFFLLEKRNPFHPRAELAPSISVFYW